MEKYNFDILIKDITSKYKKIKQDAYLEEGSYPIIDQGRVFIAGFSNEITSDNNDDLPLIIFGDHTKAIKFVDFPFNIGADGVKVLKIDKLIAYPKYVYYFLKNTSLPDAGYSRHFKFLKAIQIPLPSYENQIRIANLLEKIEAVIEERKSTIDLLDELVKATFYKMFGDPRNLNKSDLTSLNMVSSQVTDGEHTTPKRTKAGIKLLSARNIQNGFLDFEKEVDYVSDDEYKRISKRCKPEFNDILMSCSGTVGRIAVIRTEEPLTLVRSVALIKPLHDKINSYYLMHWLQSAFLQSEITKNSKKSSQANIFTGAIKELPVFIPPFDLQNQFAIIAQKIENIKAEQETQLKGFEELYASVNQKAFSGELDLSKIPYDIDLLPEIESLVNVPSTEVLVDEIIELEKKIPERKNTEEEKSALKSDKRINLTWENISFKEVADYIKNEFKEYYFNSEMLFRYLTEDLGIFVNYFSTSEQKKNPQYENADDFYRFIATALTGENIFLQLEQVFYNAEEENINAISFTDKDLEVLTKKSAKERSGIYFRIKDEIITH